MGKNLERLGYIEALDSCQLSQPQQRYDQEQIYGIRKMFGAERHVWRRYYWSLKENKRTSCILKKKIKRMDQDEED